MGLIKIFSGERLLANTLMGKLQEADINVVMRDNNQANVLPSTQSEKAVELFIQEFDYGKAHNIILDFRMNLG